MFEGDIEILLIGCGLTIVAYLITNFVTWRKKQKMTYHADVIAPIAAFVVAFIGSLAIASSQDWAIFLPFVMLIGIIPTSLVLTLIKAAFLSSKKKSDSYN